MDFPRTTHGRIRGLETATRSSTEEGRFGRLFRRGPAAVHPEAMLVALGQAMQGEGPRADNAPGTKDEEENPDIPAGYTYLGQFVDHDLTFDPVSSFDRQNDPDARKNFRTPRFDLDSLYGRGPADQPYLYLDGVRFLLGKPLFDGDDLVSRDLPRNSLHRAVIGDPRNDENKIISQLHATMLRFHNALCERGAKEGLSGEALFLHAQRATRWHYQYVVLNDLLPRLCGPEEVSRARQQRTLFHPRRAPFIPVEFSVAAYRFGHSMVRPSYLFNDSVRPKDAGTGSDEDHVPHRFPIFSNEPSSRRADMRGFGEFPDNWGFRWKYFFNDGSPSPVLQPSYRIDTSLSDPLSMLKVVKVVSDGPQSLAERNLRRGQQLGLPGAQDVAHKMCVPVLDECELFSEAQNLPAETRKALSRGTPLWYYILREAEVRHKGQRLGTVGARIVAEVMVGLLDEDSSSYLKLAPAWTPDAADGGAAFRMHDLIKIAEQFPIT